MWMVISIVMAGMLLLAGVLLALSPGKPQPFVDETGKPLAGSISEKVFVDINGVKQGMFIQSKDASHPVLLYLHGGMPDYFLTQKYPTGLEDLFTVVWWEQRGSGISYSPDIPTESITQEQLIADTLALTNYLRERFQQDKIYLMGHSGGTFIGIQAAAQAPELYHAYIGVAQMANQLESEKLAYDYMLQEFKAKRKHKNGAKTGGGAGHLAGRHTRRATSPCAIPACTASASARPMTCAPSSRASSCLRWLSGNTR